MGDYYSLKFEAELNDVGARTVRKLTTKPWPHWRDIGEPVLAEYAEMDRASYIPRGGLQLAPDGWEHANLLVGRGTRWRVCCSIKQAPESRETLVAFLSKVLPRFLSAPCEVLLWDERRLDRVTVLPDGTSVIERAAPETAS